MRLFFDILYTYADGFSSVFKGVIKFFRLYLIPIDKVGIIWYNVFVKGRKE